MKQIFLVFLMLACTPAAAFSAVRQALIVAIDDYAQGRGRCPLLAEQKSRGFLLTKQAGDKSPACPDGSAPPLRNAIADGRRFKTLLEQRFGFVAGEIEYLPNEHATATRILGRLRAHVARLQKGDRFIFYFSGHGTQVLNINKSRNRKGTGSQEALVPWDYELGASPILDVELLKIYQEASRKKLQMVVVLDSCHSGGMARGERYRSFSESRFVDIAVPQYDDRGRFAFLAAARGEQLARDESPTFTEVLTKLVASNPAPLTIAELGQLTQTFSNGLQSPFVLGAVAGKVDLEGKLVDDKSPLVYPVTKLEDANKRITIAAGSVHGLTKDSIFTWEKSKGSRFRVDVVNLTDSELIAQYSAPPDLPSLRQGDRFKLISWRNSQGSAMEVHVPASLPTAADVRQLQACAPNSTSPYEIDTPGVEQIFWSASGWRRRLANGSDLPFRCGDDSTPNGTRLVVAMPPTREMRSELLRALKPYEELLQDSAAAPFEIVGRLSAGKLEYALAKRHYGKSEALPRLTQWNRDWFVDTLDRPASYPDSAVSLDCLEDNPRCADMLMRRIQRSRTVMDLQQQQAISGRVLAESGKKSHPWEIRIFEKDGEACSARTVKTLKPLVKYCLKLVYNGNALDKWYLRLITIDGAGLMESNLGNLGDKKYPDGSSSEIEVTKVYYTMPSEGNRENFFLMASTEAPLTIYALSVEHQAPPIGKSQGNSVVTLPTIQLDTGRSRARNGSERPPSWAMMGRTFVVEPEAVNGK